MRQLDRAAPVMTASPYVDRLQRAQEEMARQGIDLLVVGPSADLFYLIGYQGHESERLSALVLPREGAPHFVVPARPLARDFRPGTSGGRCGRPGRVGRCRGRR